MRLRRTPGPGSLTATVTCDRLIGCPTHFFQRRTIPCEGDGCPSCQEGLGWRWHGYVTAVDHTTHEHFIFEMTAQAAEPFLEYFNRHGTLVGCILRSTRLGQSNNGRVMIRCTPQDLTRINLPTPPDVAQCLCKIWNVPNSETEVDGLCKGHSRIHVNSEPKQNGRKKPLQQPAN